MPMQEKETHFARVSDAFDTLRAEHEASWLHRAFVPPDGFEALANDRAWMIHGESGSGLTALRLSLTRRAQDERKLVAEWRPVVTLEGGAKAQIQNIFDACAEALLAHIASRPETYLNGTSLTQMGLRWFIRTFLIGNLAYRADALAVEADEAVTRALGEIVEQPVEAILPASAPESKVMAECVNLATRLGCNAVWLVTDGLESWAETETDAEAMTGSLSPVFSALAMFEQPGFALKVFLPDAIAQSLAWSTSVLRRRVESRKLSWSSEKLADIVQRRFGLEHGRESVALSEFRAGPEILDWFRAYGGARPRGWLEQGRRLRQICPDAIACSPISDEAWHRLVSSQPPLLRMEGDRVMIADEEKKLVKNSLRLLRYLYRNRHRTCTRQEIYYRVSRELEGIPQPGDKNYESPKEWESQVDTMIYRLRQKIEPNFREPVYVITDRYGGGVRLINAA